MKQYDFRRNDIVSTETHERLMVVYKFLGGNKARALVTEGTFHSEDDLTLVFRKEEKI